MSRSVPFWLLLGCLQGQEVKVWLRSGGPDSRKFITGASQTTPVRLTSPGHGFANGDVVWVSFLNGNLAANGVRRVRDVTENEFTVTDLNGRPVAGSERTDDIAPRYPGVKGYVGRVQEYTLVSTLNSLLDGPDGPLTGQVRDPDGTGPRKAPKANSGWAPYAGLQRRLATFISQPDRVYRQDAVVQGAIVHSAALDWFMDNQRIQSLTAARHWINNFDQFLGTPTFSACNQSYKHCGKGPFPDWMSFQAANLAYAYSLIQPQLSTAERKTFADKMLTGYEERCRNSLVRKTGLVSVAAGSTVITGTDTRFRTDYAPLADGRQRWINLRTTTNTSASPVWAQVQSVESDTSLTVTAPVSRTQAFTDIDHWSAGGWEPGVCGAVWFTANHASSPNLVARRTDGALASAISASDTTIQVDLAGNFPETVPFYVLLRGTRLEAVRVNARNGSSFTVERGMFMTEPASFPARTRATYVSHPVYAGLDFPLSTYFAPYDSPAHNLTFSKVYGYLTLGLVLAAEDERARRLLENTWNYFYDFQYPHYKATWTGITQGAYSYGPGRYLDWIFRIALSMRHSVRPSIDIGDGTWLKKLVLYPLYITLPYNPRFSLRYGDSGSDEVLPQRYVKHLLMAQSFYPGSSEAAFANFWYRSISGYYATNNWFNSDSQNNLPYAILHSSESDPSTDFRQSLPPYFFFNTTDFNPRWNPGVSYNAAVSRQNWESSSTYLWATAISQPVDHLGSYTGPASYKIIKEQYLLGENGPGTQGSGGATLNNAVQVGAPSNLKIYSDNGGQVVSMDRTAGAAAYVYFRVNSLGSYKASAKLNHIYRHFVHLKRSPNDYVVVYDDVETSEAVNKKIRLHYFADNSETPELNRDGRRFVFTRPRARLSSHVILPENPEINLSSRRPSAREIVHAVEISDESERGEFLVVHRPSSETDDVMPGVELLDNDSAFRGVLVKDSRPAVVVFPKDGGKALSSLSFASKTAAITEFLITGLSAGIYRVTSGSTTVVAGANVRRDGTLHFEAPGGSIAIERTGAAALEISPITLPLAATSQAYFAQLEAFGGEEPYSWAVSRGDLPPGLTLSPAGVISGVPSVSGGFRVTFQVTGASGSGTAELESTITVLSAEFPLGITQTSLPLGVVNQPYALELTGTGGSPPYKWALAEGTLPAGVAFSDAGALSGAPVEAGEFPFVVELTDSASGSARRSFVLAVLEQLEPLGIRSGPVIELTENEAVSTPLEATGGVRPYNWSLTAGELPEGLVLEPDGTLTGTAETAGLASCTVRVVDSQIPSASAQADLLIRVVPAAIE